MTSAARSGDRPRSNPVALSGLTAEVPETFDALFTPGDVGRWRLRLDILTSSAAREAVIQKRTGRGLCREPGKNLPRSDELPMSIKFSVLGPVCAWRGPVELNVGPNQRRAILALLLVRANQLVPVEDMMELLWEENPPTSAVNVVRPAGVVRGDGAPHEHVS